MELALPTPVSRPPSLEWRPRTMQRTLGAKARGEGNTWWWVHSSLLRKSVNYRKKCFMRLTPGCVDEENGVLLDLVDLGVVVVGHDHLHGSLLVEGLYNLFIRYQRSGKIS